jgi:hypothetical protein
VIVGAYFIEAGLLLIAAPWTGWLQRNYFGDRLPWLRDVLALPALHVLVVATGVVTVLAGMSELRLALVRRLSRTGGGAPES